MIFNLLSKIKKKYFFLYLLLQNLNAKIAKSESLEQSRKITGGILRIKVEIKFIIVLKFMGIKS